MKSTLKVTILMTGSRSAKGTVKPVLSSHSKIDKIKVDILMEMVA